MCCKTALALINAIHNGKDTVGVKAKLLHLRKSKFTRNVAVVAGGTAGAQAIAMASTPVITRLYGPEALGFLGTFTAIVSVVAPCAALTYPIAIGLPKSDGDAKGLMRLSFYLSVALTILVSLAILVGKDWFIEVFNLQSIAAFIVLIPLAMFFSAWLEIAQQWLIRKKLFSITARVAVVQSLFVNFAKIGFGWFNPAAIVLIVLAVIGNALNSIMLFLSIKKREVLVTHTDENHSATPLVELAKKYYDFPLYRAPQVFINSASQSLPVLMLASLFGPAAAGFYTLARLAMAVPSMLVGKSVGDVFYPRINEAVHNGEDITRLIVKATVVLAAVTLLPFALVVAFGPWLFSVVFGAKWAAAGVYARWLAFFFYFNLINRPSVASVPALGLQKGLLVYEIMSSASKALGLVIGFYVYSSDVIAIMLFSIIGALVYGAMIAWIIINSSRCNIYAKAG